MQSYKVDDTVIHLTAKKRGVVVEIIGGGESRYYVRHSGYTWSDPEKYLILAPNKIK